MFCFWTQMGFSHWHEPGLIAWPTHRCDGTTSRFLILISSVMYNYARNCQPDLFAWFGTEGSEGHVAISLSMLQLMYSCLDGEGTVHHPDAAANLK